MPVSTMVYNSLTFLVFFVIVLATYWSVPSHRVRLGWLLIASWVFYAAWYPAYLLLMLAATFLCYLAAIGIANHRERNPQWARRILAGTVIANLLNLAFFKYLDFGLSSAGTLWTWVTGEVWMPPRLGIFLPLGISFHTFQLIGYLVDVYRGEAAAIRNPWKMSLFVTFFPQLIAGPIVRPHEFLPQLQSKREFSPAQFLHGLDLIAVGLVKKVLIADQLAPFVDRAFADPALAGGLGVLLAVYAYAIQIYCDFSGYTDIGRGCAFALGYTLPSNFNYPYLACNVSDFWRRWHITLSLWLRDYLYIPLGGSRGGEWYTYRNLILTMTLGGLWHGASTTFIVWGLLHGVLLAVNRWVHNLANVPVNEPLFPGRPYRVLATAATFHAVCLGWIFFRAPDFATAFAVLQQLGAAGMQGANALGPTALAMAALLVAHLVSQRLRSREAHASSPWLLLRPFAYSGTAIAIVLVTKATSGGFIYFQF